MLQTSIKTCWNRKISALKLQKAKYRVCSALDKLKNKNNVLKYIYWRNFFCAFTWFQKVKDCFRICFHGESTQHMGHRNCLLSTVDHLSSMILSLYVPENEVILIPCLKCKHQHKVTPWDIFWFNVSNNNWKKNSR